MTHNKFSLRLLTAFVVMLLALSACTMQQPEVVVDPETIDETAADDTLTDDAVVDDTLVDGTAIGGVVDAENILIVASSLLDYSFNNIDGEVSGEIEDLIIDVDTGNVLYATLEYGGFLDIGDTELPVPLSAFVWGTDGQLILNIDEALLDSFPDLGTEWPDTTTAGWDDDVVNFWSGAGITPVHDFTEVSNSIIRASDAIGYGVADVGLGAGTISDMLIDLGNSQVTYALLGYDPTVYGNDLIAVPFNALSLSTVGNELVLAEGIDAATLESAPRVTTDALAAGTPGIYNDANTYWGGYGYGYGPGVTTTGEMGLTTDDNLIEDDVTNGTGEVIGVAGTEEVLARASTLLDYNVSNLNGESIGEIEDMLIDVETGRILYATLEYGGFLDIGDSEVPVPLSALSWVSEGELLLNVDEQQLEALPDVGTDWPNVADTTWNDEIVNFWSGVGIDPGYGAVDAPTIMYVSNLIDYGLGDVGLGAEGSIHDLLIDLSQSEALYATVNYGGFFENELVALPFSAVDVTVTDGAFTFTPNVDVDTLQTAPRLDQTAFEDTGLYDVGFDDEIESYWQDAGYEVGVGNGVLE